MYKVGEPVSFINKRKLITGDIEVVHSTTPFHDTQRYDVKLTTKKGYPRASIVIEEDDLIPSPIAYIKKEIDLYSEAIDYETEFPNEGTDLNIVEYQAKIEFGNEILKILGGE